MRPESNSPSDEGRDEVRPPTVSRFADPRGGGGAWTLMPPPPGTCSQCAVTHEPDEPHNQQSVYYQYAFYAEHGRWPTWDDALAHCSHAVKDRWIAALRERGVDVG